jgi:hypothetical protein
LETPLEFVPINPSRLGESGTSPDHYTNGSQCQGEVKQPMEKHWSIKYDTGCEFYDSAPNTIYGEGPTLSDALNSLRRNREFVISLLETRQEEVVKCLTILKGIVIPSIIINREN